MFDTKFPVTGSKNNGYLSTSSIKIFCTYKFNFIDNLHIYKHAYMCKLYMCTNKEKVSNNILSFEDRENSISFIHRLFLCT